LNLKYFFVLIIQGTVTDYNTAKTVERRGGKESTGTGRKRWGGESGKRQERWWKWWEERGDDI
jgi:hypothetical protein